MHFTLFSKSFCQLSGCIRIHFMLLPPKELFMVYSVLCYLEKIPTYTKPFMDFLVLFLHTYSVVQFLFFCINHSWVYHMVGCRCVALPIPFVFFFLTRYHVLQFVYVQNRSHNSFVWKERRKKNNIRKSMRRTTSTTYPLHVCCRFMCIIEMFKQ